MRNPRSESLSASAFSTKLRSGHRLAPAERHDLTHRFLMIFFGHLDAEKGWTKQLHLGALSQREYTELYQSLAPDTGFDSIGDWPQVQSLARISTGSTVKTHCRG